MRELCLSCNQIVCVDENKGRRIFYTDKSSGVVNEPIQDCTNYAALAALGLVTWRFQGSNTIFEKRLK